MDDGHPEEGVEVLLTDAGQEAEVGVRLRLFQVDGFAPFRDQAHQALAVLQAGDAHQFLVETLGSAGNIRRRSQGSRM